MARDLGDFQTPPSLVAAILKHLTRHGHQWTRVLEPTCGQGNFIDGVLTYIPSVHEIRAFEIQHAHVEAAQRLASIKPTVSLRIDEISIFNIDIQRDLSWQSAGPLLVIGNLPWITNAELGVLGSTNMPVKSNIKRLRGIDARTGQSNFDIAEHIWLKLIEGLAADKPTIALLCKTSVARNVLEFSWSARLPIGRAAIYRIDARRWFKVSVDACLLRLDVGCSESRYEANVYAGLDATVPQVVIGIRGGQVVADVHAYDRAAFLDGASPLSWRQGIKHDAASVMELTLVGDHLYNGLGEDVAVESAYVFPLYKGRDLFNGPVTHPQHCVIVPQTRLGEDTRILQHKGPHLWHYLTSHRNALDSRKSSIYENQPPFSIFGIGEYSFAPYKVCISSMHKSPKFRAIGPVGGSPSMLDDTCYFIPCSTAKQAIFITALLNHPVCVNFLDALIFRDSKRPVTKKVLQRIDLSALSQYVATASLTDQVVELGTCLGVNIGQEDIATMRSHLGILTGTVPMAL